LNRSEPGGNARVLRSALLPASLIALGLHAAHAAGCGTDAVFRARAAHARLPAAAANALGLRARASSPLPCRTLETDHFLLRYSLRGLHRVKFLPEDSALARAKDSLYASLAASPAAARDSAVIAGLDRAAAPHPAYARAMADFFESGRAYYVDHLGMKSPECTGPSAFFRAPPKPGKYAVDIADAYPAGRAAGQGVLPQTYGLTLRPFEGGMIMENDFLWDSRLDPTGEFPVGKPLQSCYALPCTGANLIHDYGAEWRAGLKVTAYHELYHAVQLTYTPSPAEYHVWYETGAVSMEERNAPEVDDYLQYLPGYFAALPSASMFDYSDLGDENPRYGNGIFHMFLGWKLGEDFDADVWAMLEKNGNDLRDALPRVIAARGFPTRKVWSEFAAQLAFSGTSAHPPFAPFSPDIPRWPKPSPQDLDLQSAATLQTGSQPPFSIKTLRMSGAAGGKALIPKDTLLAAVFASLAADTGAVAFPAGAAMALEWPALAGSERILMLANASRDKPLGADIRPLFSIPSARLFAYPNPLKRSGGGERLLFSRLPAAASLRIIAENGSLVRELAFTPDSLLWFWDLRDQKERPVLPGLYYYGNVESGLAPLIVR
jgi:hypothetical protein